MNDSSTGGYLAPAVDVPPPEDVELDALIHDLIAGVTGLPGDLVLPLWPANQPESSVDGCAFGVQDQQSDTGPVIRHDGTSDGHDAYVRHQTLDVSCVFYGPHAKGYAQRLADGLAIPQNREQMQRLDMAFVGVSGIHAAPELINQQWVRRYDMTVTLRRKITRTYPVLNLQSADVATTSDSSTPMAAILNIHS